jgi:hypothetical protein
MLSVSFPLRAPFAARHISVLRFSYCLQRSNGPCVIIVVASGACKSTEYVNTYICRVWGSSPPSGHLEFETGKNVKGKAIPVTGREGPQGCETSRLPHFIDNRLTDGGEVVSPTRRPPFTPKEIPGTHFR